MKDISEEFIDETWDEVSCFSPGEANDEMRKIGGNQPEVLDFFIPYTEGLMPEGQGVAVVLFYAINRIFDKASDGKIELIKSDEIEALYDENEKLFGDIEAIDKALLEKVSEDHPFRQPNVINFISDFLFFEPEEGDESCFEDDDRGLVFLLLKSVVDALDMKINEEKH